MADRDDIAMHDDATDDVVVSWISKRIIAAREIGRYLTVLGHTHTTFRRKN